MSLAQKEILINYLSRCVEDNYKYLELFTNFLCLTHELKAHKSEKRKISK